MMIGGRAPFSDRVTLASVTVWAGSRGRLNESRPWHRHTCNIYRAGSLLAFRCGVLFSINRDAGNAKTFDVFIQLKIPDFCLWRGERRFAVDSYKELFFMYHLHRWIFWTWQMMWFLQLDMMSGIGLMDIAIEWEWYHFNVAYSEKYTYYLFHLTYESIVFSLSVL